MKSRFDYQECEEEIPYAEAKSKTYEEALKIITEGSQGLELAP